MITTLIILNIIFVIFILIIIFILISIILSLNRRVTKLEDKVLFKNDGKNDY